MAYGDQLKMTCNIIGLTTLRAKTKKSALKVLEMGTDVGDERWSSTRYMYNEGELLKS